MKRLFEKRARLVIYIEAADLNRLTAHARGEGKTVVEWARETLLGELGEVQQAEKHSGVADVPADGGVRVVEGRADRDKRAEKNLPRTTCPHGYKVGYRCTLCGGIVK